MAPDIERIAVSLDLKQDAPITQARLVVGDDLDQNHDTDDPTLALVSLGGQVKLDAPPFTERPKEYTRSLTVLGTSNQYSFTRSLRHCCRAPQHAPRPVGQWWVYDFMIPNFTVSSKNHRVAWEREPVPANYRFEESEYIVVGIRGSNVTPKEKLLPIMVKDDQGMFKQIYKASCSLRPWPRRLISLKNISGFSIYRCFPKAGYHAPVQLHPQTQGTLALLYGDYHAGYAEPGSTRWLGWMHKEFNNGSTDPEDGKYALELVLSWSAHKFIFWGMSPIVLSLAIGIWYMLKPHEEGADFVGIVQTAWSISSYIVTAAAVFLGVLAAITQFGDI